MLFSVLAVYCDKLVFSKFGAFEILVMTTVIMDFSVSLPIMLKKCNIDA